MQSVLRLWLCLCLLLTGCGSSVDWNTPSSTPPSNNSVGLGVTSAEGGSLAHPTSGHAVHLESGALSSDATVTLTALDGHLAPETHPHFRKVGSAMDVHLGGARLVGTAAFTLPQSEDGDGSHFGVLELPGDFLLALPTTYDAQTRTYRVTLEGARHSNVLSQASTAGGLDRLRVGMVDPTQYNRRPAHVPWPSFNLYYQGAVTGQPPILAVRQGQVVTQFFNWRAAEGSLMIVHGMGQDSTSMQALMQATAPILNRGTSVFCFEYDTLSSIATSGAQLQQVYRSFSTSRQWQHIGHGLGALVSRQAMEAGADLPYHENNVLLIAGPHQGTQFANALLQDNDRFESVVRSLVMNGLMDFKNADGSFCKASPQDAAFHDLAEGSAALGALNGHGIRFKNTYTSLAGNTPGPFANLEGTLGVKLDDGFVNVASANSSHLSAFISNVVPENHLSIVQSQGRTLSLVIEFLYSGMDGDDGF